ncbi:uncharacterized protein LOC125525541 isoform X5 [Triticum urartu]|uniref:uncharacterized protein LOC125525541 isoform X5 n=1 Tax=Triticum urartu TaxID=4572 RepID=UPI002043764D|nr:uncharacterized protein LOC125525541 isoform X5 [Triticum urartu]
MAGPAAVRSGQRRRGRPPGIRAALIVRVRRAAGRVSSVDSSSTMAFAGGCGQAAVVDSGCRLRSATRRPFRSSRPGCRCLNWLMHVVCVHRLDSCQDVNVDVDSRRREISLGNRPVDCTIGSVVSVCSSSAVDGFASAVRSVSGRSYSLSAEAVDGLNVCPSGFSAGGYPHASLVGGTSSCCRLRVVPLRAAGAFGRPLLLVLLLRLMALFLLVGSLLCELLDTLDQYQLSTPQWTKLIIPRERPPWQSKLRRRVNIRH